MNKFRLLIALLGLLAIAGCDFSSQFSTHGVTRSSDDGFTYSCELVNFSPQDAPTVLMSRVGKGKTDYSFSWVTSSRKIEVDGITLHPTKQPTLYFKENGTLKTTVITNSGIWSPLFSENGPSVDEMKRVFAELERNNPGPEKSGK